MFDYSTDLLQALKTSCNEAQQVVLLTVAASDPTKEQIYMGGADLLSMAKGAQENLESFGIKNIMTLTSKHSAYEVCTRMTNVCGYQSDISVSPEWNLAPNHYYKLFAQRWLLLYDATSRGFTVLSLDSDIRWIRNPLSLISTQAFKAHAAFQADVPHSFARQNNMSKLPLNSGVMWATQRSSSLFQTVHEIIASRMSKAPNQNCSTPTCFWPQSVLNEVVSSRAVYSRRMMQFGNVRILALPDSVVGRICGRTNIPQSILDSKTKSAKHCQLTQHQAGFHAQMVSPRTRLALFAKNNSVPLALSSTLSPFVCFCKQSNCRMLNGFESYLTGLKKCWQFHPND